MRSTGSEERVVPTGLLGSLGPHLWLFEAGQQNDRPRPSATGVAGTGVLGNLGTYLATVMGGPLRSSSSCSLPSLVRTTCAACCAGTGGRGQPSRAEARKQGGRCEHWCSTRSNGVLGCRDLGDRTPIRSKLLCFVVPPALQGEAECMARGIREVTRSASGTELRETGSSRRMVSMMC